MRPIRDGLYVDPRGIEWVQLYEDVWGGDTNPRTFDVKTEEIKKMIVDDIFSSGWYTDRRGRKWIEGNYGTWRHAYRLTVELGPMYESRGKKEMRLMIERDLHRDECIGMFECNSHPVPAVFVGGTLGHPEPSFGVMIEGTPIVTRYETLSDAMDTAKRLA